MMLDVYYILLCAVILILIAILVLCILVVKTTTPCPVVLRSEKETSFFDPESGQTSEFPSLSDQWSIHLSVVVPAYEEEIRLLPMLDECLEYLESRKPALTYEVIVVSDGSQDGTAQVAREYTRKHGPNTVRVLELETNRGKGGAVRLGVQSARGAVILFADADGATKFPDLAKLESSLKDIVKADYLTAPDNVATSLGIVCGSRAHLEEQAISSRSYFRTLLMYGFHFLVWLFSVRGIRDTQCGFKLFTRETARLVFGNLHVERWAFDAELLYIAQRLEIPISEVAVNWTEIEGSKLIPVLSWLQMGKDIFLIWLRYHIGAWKLSKKVE
ncbi:Dolichyl-phosphate beta-glucosyltransferase [Cryptotermes secundus]|uniref:Dolichyl-phosphate beta-glucosyltransferase n=1 Tax=Cryptotermes secundus TaxID=105785 RepID=A0A2J7R8T5_9NEOP|nr:dolichyl-phosphate beta-glucosyltransferase [Cryptotermes secundus]PNF37239.1 Dolichyl-phosphate beta-glucosyltransferase [Cryptotermes secundus]PNF37240.1 Dolichyl-phosphate beta-glucosyltransferase [Cryptotermes secundus]